VPSRANVFEDSGGVGSIKSTTQMRKDPCHLPAVLPYIGLYVVMHDSVHLTSLAVAQDTNGNIYAIWPVLAFSILCTLKLAVLAKD